MSGKTVQYVLDVSYYNNIVLCLSVMTDNSFQLIGTSYPVNAQSTWMDYSFVIPNGATYTLGTANITPNWMYPIGNYLYIQLSATTVGYNLIVTNLSNYVGMAKSLVNNNSTSPNDSQNFLNGNWSDVYDVRLN